MKILKTNIPDLESNKKELYILTRGVSLSVQKMTDEELSKAYPVNGYALYEEENSTGEMVEVLAIKTTGTVLSTISQTFKDEFLYIADLFGNDPFSIRVVRDVSSKGRTFYTCALDI